MAKVGKAQERVNIYMSSNVKDFYRRMAEELGISISAAMVVGLKAYMDAQNGLKMSNDLRVLLEQVKSIQTTEK
jgi:hypothetical protein